MAYRFTDLRPIAKSNNYSTLRTKYGETVLDDIDGVQTLNVDGRGLVDNQYESSNALGADGIYYGHDDTMPSRIIKVEIKIDGSRNIRDVYSELNQALHTGGRDDLERGTINRLIFSDDKDKYYIAKYKSADEPKEDSNTAIVTLTFECKTPFRYSVKDKTASTSGNSLTLHTEGNARGEIIGYEIELSESLSTLDISKERYNAHAYLDHNFSAGDKVELQYDTRKPLVKINRQPMTKTLELRSRYEEMRYFLNGDTYGLNTNASNFKIIYKDRWI